MFTYHRLNFTFLIIKYSCAIVDGLNRLTDYQLDMVAIICRVFNTWASAPEDTRTFRTLEKARPVTLFS